jgi:hypothetical protein
MEERIGAGLRAVTGLVSGLDAVHRVFLSVVECLLQ